MDESLRSGFSLVVGGGISGYEFRSEQITNELKKKFGENDEFESNNFFEFVDYLVNKKQIPEHELRKYILSFFERASIDPIISGIASRSWKAIISLAFDEKLADQIGLEINKRTTARRLSIVSAKEVSPTQVSVPYYSLLGSFKDERKQHAACLTKAQYMQRRRDWRDVLKTFPDYNKAASLVFMETNRDIGMVADLINELLSLSPGLPRKLVFFKGDPCAKDDSIISLLPDHVQIHVIDSTVRKWLETVDSSRQLSLPLGSLEGINYELLDKIGEKVHVVPREDDLEKYDATSHNRVLDFLFRPSELNWEPYRQNLDFCRDITTEIKQKIDFILGPGKSGIVSLTGEAGVGKTVVMRRLAYDYANKDLLSLWLRKSLGYNETMPWPEVIKCINEAVSKIKNPQVLLFIDGAYGRPDQLEELILSLSNESFKWCLVICRRKTDEAFSDDLVSGENSQLIDSILYFPNILSEEEKARLPSYLVDLNAVPTIEAAMKIVSEVDQRNASDFLCALWYLLPETRSAISGSLSEEYFNLGGLEGMVNQFAQASVSKRDWARRAYELVTTCSGLDLPLPLEVLVNSLHIEYQDWLEACSNGEPLWGLLYDESYKDGESYAYRTRNDVVTSVLLKTLNGGFASHIGEFRCLKDILQSCEVGTPVYRETASSILIAKKKELKKRFTFEQGVELFDIALDSLPHPDRALAHHRGIWIKEMGGDLSKAYIEISKALSIDDYPLSDRVENIGNIHTSLASCVVKDLESSSVDHDEFSAKLDVIEDHVFKAEKSSPFSIYNKHVSANMFLKAAERFKGVDEELHLTSMASAVRIISSALALISSGQQHDSCYESLQMLEGLEERLFQISDDFDSNEEIALNAFNTNRNQIGFYVLSKVLISEASRKSKGRLFKRAEDYLRKVEKIVRDSGEKIDTKIIECRADLQIKWHLVGGSSTVPNWRDLEQDLKIVVADSPRINPTLYLFYLAVVLYHQNKISDSDAVFNQLRRGDVPGYLRRTRRCYYIDSQGNPKLLQGQIRDGFNKKFVYCAELSTEILCANEFKDRKDSLVHFYLAFSLLGPIAIKSVTIPTH